MQLLVLNEVGEELGVIGLADRLQSGWVAGDHVALGEAERLQRLPRAEEAGDVERERGASRNEVVFSWHRNSLTFRQGRSAWLSAGCVTVAALVKLRSQTPPARLPLSPSTRRRGPVAAHSARQRRVARHRLDSTGCESTRDRPATATPPCRSACTGSASRSRCLCARNQPLDCARCLRSTPLDWHARTRSVQFSD